MAKANHFAFFFNTFNGSIVNLIMFLPLLCSCFSALTFLWILRAELVSCFFFFNWLNKGLLIDWIDFFNYVSWVCSRDYLIGKFWLPCYFWCQTLTNILKEKMLKEGRRPYVIPVGGSNSIGTWWDWSLSSILSLFWALYYCI